ncbi:MAG TPA: hypothetical protein VF791_07165 [Pyrinomonadaceae bacterium]
MLSYQNKNSPLDARHTLCSMKITQEVRDYAAQHDLDAETALKEGSAGSGNKRKGGLNYFCLLKHQS